MFLLNRGSSLAVDKKLSIDGIVATSAGFPMEQLLRQKTLPKEGILILDPQLYFPLSAKYQCKKLFTKLSSYPWYNPQPPEYDSREIKISDYKSQLNDEDTWKLAKIPSSDSEIKEAIISCFNIQDRFGVTHYLIPTPCVVDSNDCFSTQIKWIDTGIECFEKESPLFISLSISENVLSHNSIEHNNTLQTIIDNLTTYDNIDGFYITIFRDSKNQYIVDSNIISTILELSYILGNRMHKQVILNSIDCLGFLGLAVGATGMCSGFTNKEKRLYINDYHDKSGGGALPHFFSFSFIGDLLSYRDMTIIKRLGLLNLIKNDVTQFSNDLFMALENNISLSYTTWNETKGNVTAAKLHRYDLLSKKVSELDTLSTSEKMNYILKWLKQAQNNVNEYNKLINITPKSLFKDLNNYSITEDFSHIEIWLNSFLKFIDTHKL